MLSEAEILNCAWKISTVDHSFCLRRCAPVCKVCGERLAPAGRICPGWGEGTGSAEPEPPRQPRSVTPARDKGQRSPEPAPWPRTRTGHNPGQGWHPAGTSQLSLPLAEAAFFKKIKKKKNPISLPKVKRFAVASSSQKIRGCRFVQGSTLSSLASSIKSGGSQRQLVKVKSHMIRRVLIW